MSIVRLIFCLFFLLDAYWWRVADRQLRPLGRAKIWRSLLAVFMVGQAILLLSRLLPPAYSRTINGYVPLALIAGQYLWHLGVLPFWIIAGFAIRGVGAPSRLISKMRESTGADVFASSEADGTYEVLDDVRGGTIPSAKADPTKQLRKRPAITSAFGSGATGRGTPRPLSLNHPASTGLGVPRPVAPRSSDNPKVISDPFLSRRQVLAAMAVALPPLITGGLAGVTLAQLGRFRVRSMDLWIPNLPMKLEGVTIAHLSDFHAGRFMTRHNMAPIIDTVNDMRPDLVLITGDLIDYSLIDLPPALDALKRLKPKYGLREGLAMCMGNHDIIENRFTFKRDAEAAGFPILANAVRTIEVNGHPVQLMAIDWCNGDRTIKAADMTRAAVQNTARLRDPDAFPILLAHHPHAFDEAAAAGLPLTLAGHTHGGQIMATPNFGAGSVMFRYWSGLYRKPNGSQLVVSNGIGNWFPLRLNAPAEVLRLTLRRAVPV